MMWMCHSKFVTVYLSSLYFVLNDPYFRNIFKDLEDIFVILIHLIASCFFLSYAYFEALLSLKISEWNKDDF